MAQHTTRDKVWNAALEYAKEWENTDFAKRRNRYGFTAGELIDMKDLDASRKTVSDTLLTMVDMNWLSKVGGAGGEPTEYSR
jgi:hypothetical protein